MDICFEGVGQVAATFKADGSTVKPGMAVTVSANGTVAKGAANALPCGVVLGGVREGSAAVQISGVAQVSYSGTTAPAVGWCPLACDGDGGVTKVTTGGLNCLVLAVDTDAKTAVIKL